MIIPLALLAVLLAAASAPMQVGGLGGGGWDGFSCWFFLGEVGWMVSGVGRLGWLREALSVRSLSVSLQAYFFNRALLSFYSHSLDEMLKQLDAACLGLVVVGVAFGLGVFFQNSCFTYMQDGGGLRERRWVKKKQENGACTWWTLMGGRETRATRTTCNSEHPTKDP